MRNGKGGGKTAQITSVDNLDLANQSRKTAVGKEMGISGALNVKRAMYEPRKAPTRVLASSM